MSKIFVPRTVPPQIGEKWWSTQYNHCISIYNGTVLPNCVGYAYGRFSEILGYFHPDLPMCNAGLWLDEVKKKNTLKWGTTPKLGAVAVWKESGQYGHVGIVEYIYSDGSIMLSESGYGSGWNKRFWNSGPRVSPNWYGQPYIFQGFIYNPGTEDVTNIAPYSGGVKYGTDLSGVSTLYSDVVAEYEKSISVSSVPTNTSASIQSDADSDIQKFINVILSHAGDSNDGYDWVKSKTGYNSSGWSAAMVCAASKEMNLTSIIPTDIFSYSKLGSEIVNLGGTYIKGGKQGGSEKPKVGDIFGIYTANKGSQYSASILGVVVEIQSDTIKTVEGDFQKKILTQTRRTSDIHWYVRPNWTKTNKPTSAIQAQSKTDSPSTTASAISDSTTSVSSQSSVSTYQFGSVSSLRNVPEPVQGPPQVDYLKDQTKNDAMLREVTYLTEQAKPSIKSTGTKLSAINYSGLLGKVYDVIGLSNVQYPDESNEKSYNFNDSYFVSSSTDLQGVPQIMFEFLYNKGLSVSKVIGFLANIQAECSFKTNAVNSNSGASGICQWLGVRKTNMIKYCGSDWKNNLTGQLEFMWYELQSSEQKTMTALLAVVGDSKYCAEQASEIICREFERPGNIESAVAFRKNLADELWDQLGAPYTSGVVSSNSLTTSDVITTSTGDNYSKGSIIEIPSNLPSSKITTRFSSYVIYSKSYKSGSISSYIYKAWNSQKNPSRYYIATLNGYFLVAVSSKFGSTGDAISIVLDDGTYFNALIAESRNNNTYYSYSDSSDIIEWMSSGEDRFSLEAGLHQSGWLGKNIIKVVKYGSWLT